MELPLVELVGYAASVVVAASLMMTRIVRLRAWNLAGALTFAAYGALVGAWPVLAVNLFIAATNVWLLWRLARRRESFETLEIERPDDPYLTRFLAFHGEDIRGFFPTFDLARLTAEAEGELRVRFILRDLVPVALAVYELRDCGRAVVHLDYATPAWRDLRNARFLYRELAAELAARQVREVVAPSWHPRHDDYLRRLGFALRVDQGDRRVFACASCAHAPGPRLVADAA